MCLVLADDHRFLIGCKSARTAPANSGSLKVPGPIQSNFTQSSVYTGPEQNQLCSTQPGPEILSPRGGCKDYLLQANRYPGGFSALPGSCLLLQNTSECVRAAILKTTKKKLLDRIKHFLFVAQRQAFAFKSFSLLSFAVLQVSQTLNPPAFIGAHMRFISGHIIHRCQSETPAKIYHRLPYHHQMPHPGSHSKSNFILYKYASIWEICIASKTDIF